MIVEIPVFHRQQALDQSFRYILELNQHTVLAVGGVDAPDEHRVQTHQVQAVTACGQCTHTAVLQIDPHPVSGLTLSGKLKTTGENIEPVALLHHLTGIAQHGDLAIAQRFQLISEILPGELRTDEQLQRSGINPGGQFPHLADEGRGDPRIQVNEAERSRQTGGQQQFQQEVACSNHRERVYNTLLLARFHFPRE